MIFAVHLGENHYEKKAVFHLKALQSSDKKVVYIILINV